MSKGALGLLSAYWPEDTPRYAHIPLKTIGDTTIYAIAATSPDRVGTQQRGRLTNVRRARGEGAQFLARRCEAGLSAALGSRSRSTIPPKC